LSPISAVFQRLRGEGALVAYVMGGDPDLSTSASVIDAVVSGGADIVEVGIPFSDPIADGKSIQAADVRSLAAGTTPAQVLELIARSKSRNPGVPFIVMTYYNIIFSNGLSKFLEAASGHGVDGLIVPDLPFDEIQEYAPLAERYGLDAVLLAAPTTTPSRMRAIARHTSGFLYLVSLTGVTGARAEVQQSAAGLIRSAKRYSNGVPIGVGFGISTPEHVRAILAEGADAVVVGSAIVDRVAGYRDDGPTRMLANVQSYVRSLKDATRGAHADFSAAL